MGTCYNCFREIRNPWMSCPHCGYSAAADAGKFPLALQPGSILNGRYILGRVLGQGGFGITYAAQDVQSGQRVAIKEFFPETMAARTYGHSVTAITGDRAENFSYGMQCFMAEAQTLGQFIGAENVVQVYSYFEENGTAYFAMEYVEGISLLEHLRGRGGRLSWEETKNLLFPAMEALCAIHAKGIIHRDIAPDNIYITHDGRVKLLDFGAARYSLGDRSRSLDVVLKHGYAPMEQYTRRGRQGPYTDVYAMAATVYYTLTGKLPPESVDRVDDDQLKLPGALGVSIPASAERALEKGLAVRTADRYQTMDEFLRGLKGEGFGFATDQKPVTPGVTENRPKPQPASQPASQLKPQPAPQPKPQPAPQPKPQPASQPKPQSRPKPTPQPQKKKKGLPVIVDIMVILALIAGAYLFLVRDDDGKSLYVRITEPTTEETTIETTVETEPTIQYISGDWGEKFIRSNGHTIPFDFDRPIYGCQGFTLDYEITEVEYGDLTTNNFRYEVYVRTTENQWVSVKLFQMEGLSTTQEIQLKKPMDIEAVAVVCGKKDKFQFTHRILIRDPV